MAANPVDQLAGIIRHPHIITCDWCNHQVHSYTTSAHEAAGNAYASGWRPTHDACGALCPSCATLAHLARKP